MSDTVEVEVVLPLLLSRLAKTGGTVRLEVTPPVTQRRVLEALERRYPALSGTTRDRTSGERRAYLRLFAAGDDWSDRSLDEELPEAVASGREPYLIVGAMSGG